MLPSSIRRVAAAPSPISLAGAALPRAAAAAATAALSRRGPHSHQRRYSSSSKPSSPDNGSGSKDLPSSQSVPSSSTSRSGGERRKRKAKDAAGRDSATKLPSVPSTQYLSQEALALSTFFSLHRPISVTHSFPKSITDDAFAAIFKARSRAGKVSNVISTLSRTVEQLEQPMAKMTISKKNSGGDNSPTQSDDGTSHKIEVRHVVDGAEATVQLQLNAMVGQFVPFRPPPIPEPEAAPSAATAAGETEGELGAAAAEEEAPARRIYRAVFTIEESTDEDGQINIVAHSPQLIDEGGSEGEGESSSSAGAVNSANDGGGGATASALLAAGSPFFASAAPPRSFVERMALRQLRFDEGQAQRRRANAAERGAANRRPTMLALSVVRRRKLKIKKHKMKKFLKRTKTQRKRLDK